MLSEAGAFEALMICGITPAIARDLRVDVL